jgi:hypothetical protein
MPAISVWVRTACHRNALTRALADGVDPDTSDELSLRATQLTSPRHRRTIARSLRGAVTEAHHPAATRSRMVIIRRPAVVEAEDEINTMIQRLSEPKPVRAEGVAIAERMLTHAEASPLYDDAEPGSLRRVVSVATEALDGHPTQRDELPIAA